MAVIRCDNCNGSGATTQIILGGPYTSTCYVCDGKGKIFTDDVPASQYKRKNCEVCGSGLEGLPGIKSGNDSWKHRDTDLCVKAQSKRLRRLERRYEKR